MIFAERIGDAIVVSAFVIFVLGSAYGLWVYYRSRRQRLCRGTPLARLRYDARQWRRFLRLELGKHVQFPVVLGVVLVAVVAILAAGGALCAAFQPRFDLWSAARDIITLAWPILLFIIVGLPLISFVVTLVEGNIVRWLFHPAARREAILYADGAVVGRVVLVWTDGTTILSKASVSPCRTLLILELERWQEHSEEPYWLPETFRLPIPPGQDVTRFIREAITSPSRLDQRP